MIELATRFICIVLLTTTSSSALCAEGEHYVGVKWRWFTDYIYFSSDWTLEAEPECELEYGIGVKVGDSPLGGKGKFSRHVQFTTYGFGAIHVRAIAGRAPCLVKLRQGKATAVGVYSDPSVVKGAIHDGKIVYDKVRDAVEDAPQAIE